MKSTPDTQKSARVQTGTAVSNRTRKLVLTGLFAALTCVATMVIHIQTPTMGYIHPGDALVLLSGLLLGPVYGAFAAGVGSMLADLFSGYFTYVPATLIIKALTALFACLISSALSKCIKGRSSEAVSVIIAGIIAELFMAGGYFVFEIFLLGASSGHSVFSAAGFSAGVSASAAGIPFNLVQGAVGVVLAAILFPILKKIRAQFF